MADETGEPLGIRCLCMGQEVGANGTPHLQGYLEFGIRKRLSTIRARLPLGILRAHFEPARSTRSQNYNYCKKEGGIFYESQSPNGNEPGYWHQEKRDKYMEAMDALESGE